ncbi:cell division protein FtsQ/DivIB [Magnetospirillum sp. UT-4]|uniref:cell division protein FtsQ/DivIB n=1 Tax=Magnetospirillum sp. UT-4 TaxID=2681467 RepID=UPI00137DA16F|nr:cell division protein FtsQ/DivIB [Magnetospirillum sp. UT-4]CAA7618500.1 Cell division protein FtsQ [Magnetospirillum sp. UT-4]
MRRLSDTDIVVTADDRIQPTAAAPSRPRRTAPGPRTTPSPRAEAEPKPKKTRRKRVLPRFDLTPLQKLAAGGVAVTALAVGGAVVWHSGVLQRTARTAFAMVLDATAEAGFRVADVTISGRGRTSLDDISSALSARHGSPILGIDIEAVRDRLEAIPSVRAAAVERRLPGNLHLAIAERQPVAIWQNNGGHVLVDRDGHQIPGSIAGFEGLPLVVGDGAGVRAAELLALIAVEPELAARVKAAVRVGNRRWNVMLDDSKDGLEVRLPEEGAEAAWHRLAEVERNRGLSGRQIDMVDLRVPDRMVLKTERPAAAADAVKRKDNGA